MSWAIHLGDGVLQTTGLGDRTLIFKIKISADIPAHTGYYRYLYDGRFGGGSGYLAQNSVGVLVSNSVLNAKINNTSVALIDIFSAVAGDIIEFEAPSSFGSFVIGGRLNSVDRLALQIEYIDIYDATTLDFLARQDATASDHSNTGAQPVLVDTVGNNNATGVNFSTDGSAWVDLGGGNDPVELIFLGTTVSPLSDVIALQNITDLSLLGATSQPTSDSVVLESITELLISGLVTQPRTGIITLQNITNLLLSDPLVQPTSGLITLQNLTELSFSSSTVNPSSDSITITRQGNLDLLDSLIQPESDILTLENITKLLFSDSVVSLSSDSIAIENLSQLLFSDSAVQPKSDAITIVNTQGLVLNDVVVQPVSDTIEIELYTDLEFTSTLVQIQSQSLRITQVMPSFGNNDLLLIDNTSSYFLIDKTTEYRIK